MRTWLAGIAILGWALPAVAQDAKTLKRLEQDFGRILESHYETTRGLTLTEHSRLLYGAYTTISGLAVDNEAGATRVLRQVDSKLWLEARAEGHTFYGRVRLHYRSFETGDSFTGEDSELVPPISDRYWYRFDWRTDRRAEEGQDTTWNWWVQLGRQYVDWSAGIALSDVLYAVRAGVEVSTWRLDGLDGITPRKTTIDFDGSRPGFTTDTDRQFWGFLLEHNGASHRPYVYYLHQHDGNNTVGPGGVRYGYTSDYAGIGGTGQITGEILYRGEFIKEFGTSFSDILGVFPQTIDDIDAWAAKLELLYMPRSLNQRRVRFEIGILIASGDDDRLHSAHTVGGNTSGTDDESFNSFGFADTGLALAPDLSNLLLVRIAAGAQPIPGRMQVRVDVFLINALDDGAPMSVTTVTGQSFLGTEVDLTVRWQILSDVSMGLRYGIFLPGDGVPYSDARHFAYLGVSYGF